MTQSNTDLKALELAIAKLEKQFGKNTVIYGNILPEEIPVVSTSNFKLDLALGVGGLPKGRIVEIFGGEALGKSLIALGCVAECQKAGGRAAYIDVECDLDPEWAQKLGVDMSKLIIAQPESGEEALQIAEDLIKTGVIDLMVVDSVAAMTPKSEIEGNMDDMQVGAQARMMAKGLRKLRHPVAESNTCLVFINQIRDKIGFMQQGTTSPGGRSLKFAASVRIELKRISDIKSTAGESLGTRVKAIVIKNKVAAPMKAVEYDILHGQGFNNLGAVVELSERLGLIRKSGAYYYRLGEEKSFAQGMNNAMEALSNDLKWFEELKKEISSKNAELQ
jgi:recombination protein RecA